MSDEMSEEKWQALARAVEEAADGHQLGFILLVKAISDEDGEMEMHTMASNELSLWEKLGMLRMATVVAEARIEV